MDAPAYIPGVAAVTINGGTVSNMTAGSRVTFENTVTMTGGLLTGSGSGDANGNYSFNMPGSVNAFNVTSDSSGNPAVVNVRAIGMSENNTTLVFNVTRGPAAPAADFIFGAALNEYSSFSGTGFNLTGNGVMLMTASNNYNGGTFISGGTLQLGTGQAGKDGSIGSTNGVLDNSALVYDLAGSQTASYAIAGNGSLTKVGSGTLVLSGTNGYAGGTTVAGGTLIATNNEAIADGSSLTVGDASFFPAPVVPAAAIPSASAVAAVPEPGTLASLPPPRWLRAGGCGGGGESLAREISPALSAADEYNGSRPATARNPADSSAPESRSASGTYCRTMLAFENPADYRRAADIFRTAEFCEESIQRARSAARTSSPCRRATCRGRSARRPSRRR